MRKGEISSMRVRKKSSDIYNAEVCFGPFETKKKAMDFIAEYIHNYYKKED